MRGENSAQHSMVSGRIDRLAEKQDLVVAAVSGLHTAFAKIEGKEAGREGVTKTNLDRWLLYAAVAGVIVAALGGPAGIKRILFG